MRYGTGPRCLKLPVRRMHAHARRCWPSSCTYVREEELDGDDPALLADNRHGGRGHVCVELPEAEGEVKQVQDEACVGKRK